MMRSRFETTGGHLSPVRIEFQYRVTRRGTDRALAAIGRTMHAATTADGRPCRLPERVHEVFA